MVNQKLKIIIDILLLIFLILTMVALDYRRIHTVFGIIFFVLMLLHFALNFRIFTCMLKNLFKSNKCDK
jgi:hypothetical protein